MTGLRGPGKRENDRAGTSCKCQLILALLPTKADMVGTSGTQESEGVGGGPT